MPPRVRKAALTAHVVASVGWLGAVAGFLALAIAGVSSENSQIVRGAYVSMDVLAWFVIVPLCLASLVSGIVQSLGTSWGLFRHYWVVVKFLLTVVATIVLLLQMQNIDFLGARAADAALTSGEHRNARSSLLVHAIGGLVVLLATTILAVHKPPGRTRYGWRKHDQLRTAAPP